MHSLFARVMAFLHRLGLVLTTRILRVKRSYSSLFHHDPRHEAWQEWQTIRVPPESPGGKPHELIFPHTHIQALGMFLASAVVVPMETDTVHRLLPAGLEPGPQSVLPPGQHPVLVVFGHHRHVRPNFVDVPGMDYLEFLVAVPHVQWVRDRYAYRGPFVYMPRLFLNEWLPILLGWLAAYAKRPARVRAAVEAYHVRGLLRGESLIEGRFEPRGKPMPASAFPSFQPLRELFTQPIIGQTPLGFYLCTFFDFQFDRGKMQSLAVDLRIEQPFARSFPRLSHRVPGIDEAPLGGFRFLVPWSLTAPFEPGLLRAEWKEQVRMAEHRE